MLTLVSTPSPPSKPHMKLMAYAELQTLKHVATSQKTNCAAGAGAHVLLSPVVSVDHWWRQHHIVFAHQTHVVLLVTTCFPRSSHRLAAPGTVRNRGLGTLSVIPRSPRFSRRVISHGPGLSRPGPGRWGSGRHLGLAARSASWPRFHKPLQCQLPSGARFFEFFLGEGFPFNVNQPKKTDACFICSMATGHLGVPPSLFPGSCFAFLPSALSNASILF